MSERVMQRIPPHTGVRYACVAHLIEHISKQMTTAFGRFGVQVNKLENELEIEIVARRTNSIK